jgi:hypothetical protein
MDYHSVAPDTGDDFQTNGLDCLQGV